MNAKLIAHAMLVANPMQRDPGAGCVAEVIVKIIARGPARHRALLHSECETALLRAPQQRNEMLLKVDQIPIHTVLLIPAHKPTNGVRAQQGRGFENAHHEVVLFLSQHRIVMQHVVEIGDIRQADARRLQGSLHAPGARFVERLAQVQSIRDRIEHGFRWNVGLGWMERSRKLDAIHSKFARKIEPLFNPEPRAASTPGAPWSARRSS